MNSLQEKISAQILEESKERFAAEVATAFRMTGRSLYHCSKNEIGVRLEAFYNGTFFIPYYVKFRLNSLIRSDSFDVQFQSHMIHRPIFFVLSHSLPQCVPIQELERKHLSPGILVMKE
ncbi:hypothetical protein BDF22DRAFT_687721 [Syncephalis plumigaleata]|nr:hypothetical protein BDF22DRAFT_687721 [Syncephalis plumigaleata]